MQLSRDEVFRIFNVRDRGGDRRPLMFAHGFGCDQSMWDAVAPAFEDEYRVVLFDHVGAGASDPSAYDRVRHSDLAGYAADVNAICDALDLRNVTFVGHSVSATIGVLAAIRRPERFSDLVLIGPSPCYLNDGDYRGGFDRSTLDELLDVMDSNFLGWSSAIAPTIMGNADRPELGTRLAESFCRADPVIVRQFARVTFFSDNRADLPGSRTPALILQCADDVIAPDPVGAYMHEHLPHSRLLRLKASGHCPHVSDPDEVIAVMRAHLRDVAAHP